MKMRLGFVTLLCFAAIFFAACDHDSGTQATSSQSQSSTPASVPSPVGGATLSASPNPVPASDGLGSTTVSWATENGVIGQLYVSVNGGPEKLMGEGDKVSLTAPWIQAGKTDFRLYVLGDHTRLLATVTVTKPISSSASNNPSATATVTPATSSTP